MFAGRRRGLRRDAGGRRLLLLGRVGLRINDVERDLAVGGANVLSQHLPHALGVVLEADGQGGGAAGEIEIELDGLFDLAEEGLGAGRERVNFLGGEIEPGRERRGEIVDEDEASEQQGDGEKFDSGFHRASRADGSGTVQRSSTSTFKKRQNPARERKKMTSLGSMMPFTKPSKWLLKLKFETASPSHAGSAR